MTQNYITEVNEYQKVNLIIVIVFYKLIEIIFIIIKRRLSALVIFHHWHRSISLAPVGKFQASLPARFAVRSGQPSSTLWSDISTCSEAVSYSRFASAFCLVCYSDSCWRSSFVMFVGLIFLFPIWLSLICQCVVALRDLCRCWLWPDLLLWLFVLNVCWFCGGAHGASVKVYPTSNDVVLHHPQSCRCRRLKWVWNPNHLTRPPW